MSDVPFSKKYLHDLKALYKDHEEKRITDDELSQRIDELRKREMPSHEHVAYMLLMQKMTEAEKGIESEIKEDVLKKKREEELEEQAKRSASFRQLQKQQREKYLEEQKLQYETGKKERERSIYRSEIDDYINRLENDAKNWQIGYTWLQITLLFFSALTATMAGIEGVPRWLVSVSGLIATIAGGLLTTFKIQERIYATRRAIAELRLECQKYDYHIEEYTGTNPEDVFIKFSRSITSIRGQQMLQDVEFWNPKKEEKNEEKTVPSITQENREDKENDNVADDDHIAPEEKIEDSDR